MLEKKRKLIIFMSVGFTLTVAGILWWHSNLETQRVPDPKSMTPVQAVKFMATEQFADLSDEQKSRYLKGMHNKEKRPPMEVMNKLTDEERKAIRKNVGRQMHREMKERIKKFFRMTKDEQDKFLDKMIKEMEEHRAAGRSRSGGDRPGPPSSAMMQAMLENTDSSSRAMMHEFHKRMHDRMTKK